MEKEEQLVRVVKTFGNGAHIFAPKEWVGEQIILIKQPKKSLKEKIICLIEPYLEDITGAYLYGSYARAEQKEDSDIDLLIITNKKIKIEGKGFEINCIEEKNIEKAIKIEPLLIFSILSEAQAIINSKLLENIKNNPETSDMRVVILSNLGEKDDIEKGLQMGAEGYIIKSHFTPTEVVAEVNRILQP